MAHLVIEQGDCRFHGTCECGEYLGEIRPDQSLDVLGEVWERHVMTDAVNGRRCPIGPEDF